MNQRLLEGFRQTLNEESESESGWGIMSCHTYWKSRPTEKFKISLGKTPEKTWRASQTRKHLVLRQFTKQCENMNFDFL